MSYTLDEWDQDADFDRWFCDETGREINSRLSRRASAWRILEIGCASGRMTAALAGPGRMILACSLNEQMIQRARERNLDGVRWVCGDVLDMRAMQFDVIVCASVLHEVVSVGSILAKCSELLAPNGRVFVTVPSAYSLHFGGKPHLSERSFRFGVRRLWSPQHWAQALSGFGLQVAGGIEMMLKPYENARMACLAPEQLEHLASYRGPGGAIVLFELEEVF